VAVGVDARNIRGSSDEVAYASGRATALIDAGGRETAVGVFVQDFTRIGRRVVLAGSLRYDRWRNYDAFSANRPLATNNRSINRFADRIEDAFSPQAAFLITIGEDVSLYANAARSFRAPTLNELYRAFRVGSILTLANENLSAERATNIEGGVNYARRRVSIRASAFHIALDDAVGNITLSSTPDLITRRRQNAGKNTSRGLELEAEWRVRRFTVSGGYLFADARVTDFPTNPQRVNLRVPQVPRHQYTLQTRISPGKWTLAAQARGSGSQFDDDLNIFLLERYFQADVTVGRDLRENLRLYAAVENVFNSRYSIGRTPIRSVNSPANFRVGIRWK
jgi:outer membrane receptor protein involved in Fe transport